MAEHSVAALAVASTVLKAGQAETVREILTLHRHQGGYITFPVRDEERGMQHLYSIRSSFLCSMFPQFAEQLLLGGTVSLNACFAPYSHWKPVRPGGVLSEPGWTPAMRHKNSLHCEKNMRYLNACYADLDGYKDGLSVDEMRRAVLEAAERGEVPQPSAFCYSGRGIWVLWFLHDRSNPEQSHLGGQPDVLVHYKSVNKGLGTRLARCRPDRSCVSASSFLGLPGSIKVASGLQVRWEILQDAPSYTLKELGAAVGVEQPRHEREALQHFEKPTRERKRVIGKEESAAKRRGWQAAAQRRLGAFAAIREAKGGSFAIGLRHNAVFLYAFVLKSCRWKEPDARREVCRMGAEECQPALSTRECEATVRCIYASKAYSYISYEQMANRLELTLPEASAVTEVLGIQFPAASTYGRVEPKLNRPAKTKRRHLAIKKIIEDEGSDFCYGEIQRKLALQGIKASVGTLCADFKELKLARPPRGRRKARNQQSESRPQQIPLNIESIAS